ncbi:hypothetical protein P4O66_005281 [Electrophorus voltai]|uniref:Pulmonary surfactant-associated protein B n=1 Tax=Electrophorus voltai TaxID=2609070 RepID=A0AAD9E728_9TELE|nr:hypothetical protein P4O66_005281 [Electrophorus voltai]
MERFHFFFYIKRPNNEHALNSVKDKNMCNDCIRITELLLIMLSHQDTQKLIEESLKEICRGFSVAKVYVECMETVRKYLPSVIKGFLSFGSYREGEICIALQMCAVHPENNAPEVLTVGLEAAGVIQAQSSTGASQAVQITPQCTFCLFIIKKLEDMLPKERTEESVVKLLEKICDHLPQHYKEQCNNFLEKYGKQLIDLLLSTATPHAICMLLHLCLVQETPAIVPSLPSDCQSCKTLVILTQVHLGQNATDSQTSSMLQKICQSHTNALPGCKLFIQRHDVALVRILSKDKDALNACQEIFCLGHE